MQGYNASFSPWGAGGVGGAWVPSSSSPSSSAAAQAPPATNPSEHSRQYSQQQLKQQHPELDTTSDEFRMFCFKITPCTIKSTHPWDSCPFCHPHENARRRDPRTHAYAPEPCPDYRGAGLCLLGASCPFSHGVYERHLHPARYRTRPCAEGNNCTRRVCFFAHGTAQLREPTFNQMTASDAEAIRRTRLAAIADDPAQPPAVREQAAALYAGRPPPLVVNNGGGGMQHHNHQSLYNNGSGSSSGSGDFSSASGLARAAGGSVATAAAMMLSSAPPSGPGTPLSSTSAGGEGGINNNGSSATSSGFSPFAPPEFGNGAGASKSMLLHQQSVPSRFGPGAAATTAAAATMMATMTATATTLTATTTQPCSAASTPTAASAVPNPPIAVEGARMSMAVRRQLGMAPPSRSDSGISTAPGSPSAARAAAAAAAGAFQQQQLQQRLPSSPSSFAAALQQQQQHNGFADEFRHHHHHHQQFEGVSAAIEANAAATAALLLSARPAGLRPVATSMPTANASAVPQHHCSPASTPMLSSLAAEQHHQHYGGISIQCLPRGVGSSGSGGSSSEASCGIADAFGGSGGGGGRMMRGTNAGSSAGGGGVRSGSGRRGSSSSSGGSGAGDRSSGGGARSSMSSLLKNVPVGRAGPSGDLGEAVARLGVRFSFMGDGGSE